MMVGWKADYELDDGRRGKDTVHHSLAQDEPWETPRQLCGMIAARHGLGIDWQQGNEAGAHRDSNGGKLIIRWRVTRG